MTVYEQGTVVVATDPFGRGRHRPWIVVSNTTHPFDGEECLAVAVTTTARERALALSSAFVQGGLPQESYASPCGDDARTRLDHAHDGTRLAGGARTVGRQDRGVRQA